MILEEKNNTHMVDLHVHTRGSDGTDSPDELLEKALEKGMKILAATEHDNLSGSMAVAEAVSRCNVPEDFSYIHGVEMSSRITDTDKDSEKPEYIACHLLGYGYDPSNEVLRAAIQELKDRRHNSVNYRLQILKDRFGIAINEAEREKIFANRSPGRPHIADVLVDRGLVSDTKEGFAKYLKTEFSKVPLEISRIPAEKAIAAIKAAGGIAVWAHPLGGEGEKHLSEEEFERRLEKLKAVGVQGLECYYSRYSAEEIEFLKGAAQKNNLLISGGSDYHGLKKNIALGELRADGLTVAPEELTLLTELLKK